MRMNFTFFEFWEALDFQIIFYTNYSYYLFIPYYSYYLKIDLSKLRGSLENENMRFSSSLSYILYLIIKKK